MASLDIHLSIDTIIVDDEPLARQLVESLLSKDTGFRVVARCANGEEALESIRRLRPRLMFLDIQMPGFSGFDLLEKLQPQLIPYIIFITAYDQYALRAFEIHALDYLLKPFEKDRFYQSLARAKEVIYGKTLANLTEKMLQLARFHSDTLPANLGTESPSETPFLKELVIREGGRLLAIKSSDIIWLEAANQYARIHTLNNSHLLSRSLDTLQKQLDNECFFRIHRSAVVNVHFIKEVRTAKNATCDIILTTGKQLKLSRSRKHILPELLKRCS